MQEDLEDDWVSDSEEEEQVEREKQKNGEKKEVSKQNDAIDHQSAPSMKYTIVPLHDAKHIEILETFLAKPSESKRSLCRFFLRGNCIFKSEWCKFGHGVDDLADLTDLFGLPLEEYSWQAIPDKETRRNRFANFKDFNQKALFLLKHIDYVSLFHYQFTPYYSSLGLKIHEQSTITNDTKIKLRLREILHRENWSKMMVLLEKHFPEAQFTDTFLKGWFDRLGFSKPQTRSKFGDFLRYLTVVRGYKQFSIRMPPNESTERYFFITPNRDTYLQSKAEELSELKKMTSEKGPSSISEPLPSQFRKRYFCRYMLVGNCQMKAIECHYAHAVEELQYDPQSDQVFPSAFRQPLLSHEERLNFLSLHHFTSYELGYEYSLSELNESHALRGQLRYEMQMKINKSFLNKIINESTNWKLPVSELERMYLAAGFNHTDENKFQHLENMLWELGYWIQEVSESRQIEPELPSTPSKPKKSKLEKRSIKLVVKIPSIDRLDSWFRDAIRFFTAELESSRLLLQSTLRRKLYALQNSPLPLHLYLRLKNQNLYDLISQTCPESLSRIAFEDAERKGLQTHLLNALKFFLKQKTKEKKKILNSTSKSKTESEEHKTERFGVIDFSEVELFVKSKHEIELNLNNYTNIRQNMIESLIKLGNEVYLFSCGTLVHAKTHYSGRSEMRERTANARGKGSLFERTKVRIIDKSEDSRYSESIEEAEANLSQCRQFGVDLEGILRDEAHIDLIQISCKPKAGEKYIYIFDLLVLSEQHPETYRRAMQFIRNLFQDENRIKYMHDCRQDSWALSRCGIVAKGIIDTAGMDVYFSQKRLYEEHAQRKSQHQESETGSFLRKLQETKDPGLNDILEKWGAPHGPNLLKQEMKERFRGPREYFTHRPIASDFLEYSARDVEDLIIVGQTMRQADLDGVALQIGQLYSLYKISNSLKEPTSPNPHFDSMTSL